MLIDSDTDSFFDFYIILYSVVVEWFDSTGLSSPKLCLRHKVTELRVGYPDDFFFIIGLGSGSKLRSEFFLLVSASLLLSNFEGESANWKCCELLSALFDWIPSSVIFLSTSEESSSVLTFLIGNFY